MKQARRLIILLLIALVALTSWGIVSAQTTIDLSQSHITSESITFNYPAGWILTTETNFVSITDGTITIEFYTPTLSDSVLGISNFDVQASVPIFFTLNAVNYTGNTTLSIGGQEVVGGLHLDQGQGQYVFVGIAKFQPPPGWTFISVKGSALDLLGATDTIVAIINSYGSFQVATGGGNNAQLPTLAPPNVAVTPQPTSTAEPCFVRARGDSTEVRVGPGNNRAIFRTSIAQNTDFAVLGTFVTTDGAVWWRLDKTQFAGTSVVNEVWVADRQVTQVGGCDRVGEVAPPPIIRARPTAAPTGTPATNNGTPQPTTLAPDGSTMTPEPTLVFCGIDYIPFFEAGFIQAGSEAYHYIFLDPCLGPRRIFIEMYANGNDGLDPFLDVFIDDVYVGSDDDSGGNFNAYIEINIPAGANYISLTAKGYNFNTGGSYEILAESLP